MPKFTLPERGDEEYDGPAIEEAIPDVFPNRWDRLIRVPINDQIVKSLKVGESTEIRLSGEIRELSSMQTSAQQSRNFLELDLTSVDVSGKNEFERMSMDED